MSEKKQINELDKKRIVTNNFIPICTSETEGCSSGCEATSQSGCENECQIACLSTCESTCQYTCQSECEKVCQV